jgi:hypothetical protein
MAAWAFGPYRAKRLGNRGKARVKMVLSRLVAATRSRRARHATQSVRGRTQRPQRERRISAENVVIRPSKSRS